MINVGASITKENKKKRKIIKKRMMIIKIT